MIRTSLSGPPCIKRPSITEADEAAGEYVLSFPLPPFAPRLSAAHPRREKGILT